jgi:hypothetical protein
MLNFRPVYALSSIWWLRSAEERIAASYWRSSFLSEVQSPLLAKHVTADPNGLFSFPDVDQKHEPRGRKALGSVWYRNKFC